MQPLDRILASIESDNHRATVVDKAVQLSDQAQAQLLFARRHFDTVIDEPGSAYVTSREDVTAGGPAAARGHTSVDAPLGPRWDSTGEWDSRIHQRLIEVARHRHCDLIVKDTYVRHRDRQQLLHTAHDWHLLHHADVPVMMLKPKRWARGAAVVAAIDVFDSDKRKLNAHLVRYAHELCALLDGRLHLVNALPLSGETAREYGVTDFRRWLDGIRHQRLRRLERLVEDAEAAVESIQVVAGVPWKAVARVVEQLDAEFLVIGRVKPAVQRYLGTTSELLLHTVSSDVVSVP